MTAIEYAIARCWQQLNEAATRRRLKPGEHEFLERMAPVMKAIIEKERPKKERDRA